MTELEITRTKHRALKVYAEWKFGQLLPLVQRWANEGHTNREIERRLDAFKLTAQEEMKMVLRAVTVYCLKNGTLNNANDRNG